MNRGSEVSDQTSILIQRYQPSQADILVIGCDIAHHHRDICRMRAHVKNFIRDLKQLDPTMSRVVLHH